MIYIKMSLGYIIMRYNNSMTCSGLGPYALYCNNAITKFRVYHGFFAEVCGPNIMAFIEK